MLRLSKANLSIAKVERLGKILIRPRKSRNYDLEVNFTTHTVKRSFPMRDLSFQFFQAYFSSFSIIK